MAEGHTYLRTHDLSAEHMLIRLGDAVTELSGLTNAGDDRRAITLVRQGGLSVVLTRVAKDGSLEEHSAPGAVTVHVLDGKVRMTVGDETLEATGGDLIAFDSGVRHSVHALEDATLLLTLAMPKS